MKTGSELTASVAPPAPALIEQPAPVQTRGIKWVFLGPQGMRAGWSAAIYLGMFIALIVGMQALAKLASAITGQSPAHAKAQMAGQGMSPLIQIFGEGILLLIAIGFTGIMCAIEKRNILDYNLRGPRRWQRFLSGLVAGFVALSVLVGGMTAGGWLHFGPAALHGWPILAYAAAWGFGFLLVGLTEEGVCRCYLQFTLTRGINFWWALGAVAFLCTLLLFSKDPAIWGVYAFALIGLAGCLWLYLAQKDANSSFWYAAWATSTFFGAVHVSNNGETWIGLFGCALVGFVFCASIWATGSAWWAIGCHAAWDWAESYFYGTADSGTTAQGHLLTTTPAGNVLFSGGSDGPEGSLLMIPVILLLLVAVVVIYRRKQPMPEAALEQA